MIPRILINVPKNTLLIKDQNQNMFKRWGQYIYYRYYPDTNNDMIDKNEVMLIRAIKPDFNEEIPDKLDYQPVTKAF